MEDRAEECGSRSPGSKSEEQQQRPLRLRRSVVSDGLHLRRTRSSIRGGWKRRLHPPRMEDRATPPRMEDRATPPRMEDRAEECPTSRSPDSKSKSGGVTNILAEELFLPKDSSQQDPPSKMKNLLPVHAPASWTAGGLIHPGIHHHHHSLTAVHHHHQRRFPLTAHHHHQRLVAGRVPAHGPPLTAPGHHHRHQ